MAKKLSPDAHAALHARINAVPGLAALVRARRSASWGSSGKDERAAVRDLLAKAGIELPDNYGLGQVDPATGQIELHFNDSTLTKDFLKAGAIFGAATLGGYGLQGALAGGGAAGAGGGAAAGTLPSTATTSTMGATVPGLVSPGVAGGSGAVGGSAWGTIGRFLRDNAAPLIGAGAGLAGTKIAADANTDAARIQAEADEKALALQKEMYEKRRADLAPYLAAGQGSVATLSNLMGIPQPGAGAFASRPTGSQVMPPSTVPAIGQGVRQSLMTMGQQPGQQKVKAPDGSIRLIPQHEVQNALANGGQVV